MISNRFTEHIKTLRNHICSANTHVRVFGYFIARGLLARLSGEHQLDAAAEIIEAMGLDATGPMENVWYGIDAPEEVRGWVRVQTKMLTVNYDVFRRLRTQRLGVPS